jgi:protein-S-isoprenylcysteine O-methyltransferase Ste14
MIRRLLDGPLKGFPDLPPVWLAGFLAAAWVLDRGLPVVQVFGPAWQALGAALIPAGLALIGWSAWWFRARRTTIEPHHTPTALIVEGPYRLSRNPIYLGLLGLLAGAVLWLGSLSALILPFVYFRVLETRFVAPEEAALRRLFGAEAIAYLERTRRWI